MDVLNNQYQILEYVHELAWAAIDIRNNGH